MKLGVIAAGAVLTMLSWSIDTAFAQIPYRRPTRGSSINSGPPRMRVNRPTVSPYLNLLSGRGIGFEYYGQVRPQQQFRRATTALDKSIQTLAAEEAQLALQQQPAIGTTGHAATFMNHSRYFGVGLSGSPTGSASPTGSSFGPPRQ